ncbi:MAG TPA: hypothetical protein ENF73_03720, partial [Proteobacteria bacterium]|nr:hypothetical protein [Pseudomonadota bacterium]
MRKALALAVVVAVLCVLAGDIDALHAAGSKDRLHVQLFVMSDCPYGRMAENSIIRALKALKGYIDFELRFVVSQRGDKHSSLHGQKEV